MDETIWGGLCSVGVSSMISETFGKVAHPLPRLNVEANRTNNKKGVMIFMHGPGRWLYVFPSADDSNQDDHDRIIDVFNLIKYIPVILISVKLPKFTAVALRAGEISAIPNSFKRLSSRNQGCVPNFQMSGIRLPHPPL